MLFADLRDLVERGFVAAADEQDFPLIFAGFQLVDDLDRIRLAERKIEHDESRDRIPERSEER